MRLFGKVGYRRRWMKQLRGDPCFSAVHERARLGADCSSIADRPTEPGGLGWARIKTVSFYS